MQLLGAEVWEVVRRDPYFHGHCLRVETGIEKGTKDEILSEADKNRGASPVENGGIKFIQAVPISRKSRALKAGIRSAPRPIPQFSLSLSLPLSLSFSLPFAPVSHASPLFYCELKQPFCPNDAILAVKMFNIEYEPF